jgi:hypothetical protein
MSFSEIRKPKQVMVSGEDYKWCSLCSYYFISLNSKDPILEYHQASFSPYSLVVVFDIYMKADVWVNYRLKCFSLELF